MQNFSLSHLSDPVLLRELSSLVVRDRAVTAALLAHLAEVDARRLYLPAAYPSMHAWCVGELRFSEEAAFKRIRVARAARQFPAIFAAIADGSLHLSAVVMLASFLTEDNAGDLLAAAAHRCRAELEQLLAERFPRPDVPERVAEVPVSEEAPGLGIDSQLSPGTVAVPVSARDQAAGPRPGVAPVSAERFALQCTVGRATYDKLCRAKALLGHRVPAGELSEVLDRALDALVRELEKRKFAATSRPRARQRHATTNPRQIPAAVKRAVWERDGGRCTFVAESGRRCEARDRLEFDHVEEVARGGRATTTNLRLRCRAHNQYAAERTYGVEFMNGKRHAARGAAEDRARARAERACAAADRERAAAETAAVEEVVPWLRELRLGKEESRRAAEAACRELPGASLEARVRRALGSLARSRPVAPFAMAAAAT